MCKCKNVNYIVKIGDVFNYLTIINIYRNPACENRVFVSCVCKCGKHVDVLLKSILSENTKSCGCYNKLLTSQRNHKHGFKTRTGKIERLYNIWVDMHKRCNNENSKSYKDYGLRNIKVCDEWSNYVIFREWALQNGYDDSLTIERIDNNKGYNPQNCKWIPKSEQSKNRRNIHYLTYKNETHSLSDWAKILNVSRSWLSCQINTKKLSLDKIIELKNLNYTAISER